MSPEYRSAGSKTELMVVVTAVGALAAGALWMVNNYLSNTANPPHTCEDALRTPTLTPTRTPAILPDVRVVQRWQGVYECRDPYSPHPRITQTGRIIVQGVIPLADPCPFRTGGAYELVSCSYTYTKHFPILTPKPPTLVFTK